MTNDEWITFAWMVVLSLVVSALWLILAPEVSRMLLPPIEIPR